MGYSTKIYRDKQIGYATNSEGDNHSGVLNYTGIGSTKRNNIYDIGENVMEWTTYGYVGFRSTLFVGL